VLASNDFRAGFDRASLSGPVGRMYGWAADTGFVGPLEPPSLLVTEPPDHTRYRKLVTRVFSVRAVEQLRARTEQVAAGLLDDLADLADLADRADRAAAGRPVDLVADYCTLLPVTVICEMLGVPAAERRRILAFGEAAAPSLDLGLTWHRFREVEAALAEFDAWLGEHLRALADSPGDDLLSQLVTVRDDGGGLTERELKATAGLVLAAGFETTVNLLGNGVALLRRHPDQLAGLQADPAGWPNAVEEILRVDPPVLLTGRTAVRDTEVAGVPVPAGALVTTVLAAANRDPDVFADPDVFDLRRPDARHHLGFGHGIHFCVGAPLARLQGRILFEQLAIQLPGLRLLAEPEQLRGVNPRLTTLPLAA
jgi:cytochrome P450